MSSRKPRAERRREARQARKARPPCGTAELLYPLDNLSKGTADSANWLAEREKRGATRVDLGSMFNDAVVVFPASTSRPFAEPCVEMYEFISAASRFAAAGVEVLDRLNTEDDPHLLAALKRYVEDTGQALKEVDNRLKKLHSGLNELFPEISSWKDLISRRDVIAHKILTLDDDKVRKEADRDFRALCQLLSNIHFAPTVIDLEQGIGPEVAIRSNLLRELAPSEAGQEAFVLGSVLVVVCLDARKGIVAFRLGRSPDNKALLAVSHTGEYTFTVSNVNPPDMNPQTE
ncbi:MAG: hypothetical protein OXE17_06130 [Chloroflexi bacterium]|nr:hypothetical protein [Chloroflexota bacterium]